MTDQTTPPQDDNLASALGDLTAVTAEIEQLKTELEQSKVEADAMKETATRALADLQNYKRRSEEEKSEFIKFAAGKAISSILPALDNFKRAFSSIPSELQGNDWVKGIEAIEKSLFDALAKEGLEPIKTIGEKCDPTLHECLLLDENQPDGIICGELEPGYLLNGKVLRVARVQAGSKK